MKNPLLKVPLFVLSLILFSNIANALELKLITENAPPNSYIENGSIKGVSVEIVRAVLKEVGMEGHRIFMYPWARGYLMLKTQKKIVLFPTSRTRYREKRFKWAGPISDNRVNLYKLKSRTDIKATKLKDLKIYSVGTSRFDQKYQYLKSKGFTLQAVSEDKQNIDKLLMGRIDLIAYAERRLSYDLRRYDHDQNKIEKVMNLKDVSTKMYLAFSKFTEDSVVKKFQLGFDAIKRKKIKAEILKRWK
jgi:polar amino acid transport system substrate-binding protein